MYFLKLKVKKKRILNYKKLINKYDVMTILSGTEK